MFLEKLTLQGFKSFAQKTTLEFPHQSKEKKGITAIVGPNGCGKSNLGEGIRWALGEQSLKTLRGKKSEDVIFSGSDKKCRLGMAEVILFFNNEAGTTPIDYSQFTISRRIYRNGESEYLINKKRVRLRDILILLAKTNFGQRSYSIIGQGMIDSVLLASSRTRKDLFDEATGVRAYQLKREEAGHKIEKTKTNLKQAEIALQELAPRTRSLARQAAKLARREKIESQLKELQEKYYGSLWQEINKKWQKENKEIQIFKEKTQVLEEKLKKVQKEMKSLAYQNTSESPLGQLEEKEQKLIQARNELLQKQAFINGQLEAAKVSLAQIPEVSSLTAEDIVQISKDLEKIKKLAETLIETVAQTKNLKNLDKISQMAKEVRDRLIQILKKFHQSADRKEKDETSQLLQQGQPSFVLQNLGGQARELAEEIEKLNSKTKEINQQADVLRREESDKRKDIFLWQEKFQKIQQELNKINQDSQETRIELAHLETRKETLEEEIKEEMGEQGIEIISSTKIEAIGAGQSRHQIIERLKRDLELIGGIDPEVSKEYEECRTRYDFLNNQVKDLTKASKSLNKIIKELDEKIEREFHKSFAKINQKFEKYFQVLFNGGKAKLVLQKEEKVQPLCGHLSEEVEPPQGGENDDLQPTTLNLQPTITDIDILATPPGKKLKSIDMLSGGEKALASLALILGIISCNTPPFVVLDEVDAALDESNSQRFANILEKLSQKTQFIVITHNRATMQKANILYGVTMGNDGISRLLSLKLGEAAK